MTREGRYEVVMGTDIVRGGAFLELWDAHPSSRLSLEVFYSDADGSFTTTRYRSDVPPEIEAWFQAEARRRLPRVRDDETIAPAGQGTSEA